MTASIRFERNGPVARLILDRAERRNALTRLMIEQMTQFVQEVGGDASARVLVIGASGNVFCAGMDLDEMQARSTADNPSAEWRRDAQALCDLLVALVQLPLPVVTVLPGPVLAGGVGLVLACDLAIASDTAFVALPEPQRGITASIVTPLLVHRIGAGNASRVLLSGERFLPERTEGWGLWHRVVPAAELSEAEADLVQMILSGSPQALAATKRNVYRAKGVDVVGQLEQASKQSAVARGTDDAQEGLRAFLEKRKPDWQI